MDKLKSDENALDKNPTIYSILIYDFYVSLTVQLETEFGNGFFVDKRFIPSHFYTYRTPQNLESNGTLDPSYGAKKVLLNLNSKVFPNLVVENTGCHYSGNISKL